MYTSNFKAGKLVTYSGLAWLPTMASVQLQPFYLTEKLQDPLTYLWQKCNVNHNFPPNICEGNVSPFRHTLNLIQLFLKRY